MWVNSYSLLSLKCPSFKFHNEIISMNEVCIANIAYLVDGYSLLVKIELLRGRAGTYILHILHIKTKNLNIGRKIWKQDAKNANFRLLSYIWSFMTLFYCLERAGEMWSFWAAMCPVGIHWSLFIVHFVYHPSNANVKPHSATLNLEIVSFIYKTFFTIFPDQSYILILVTFTFNWSSSKTTFTLT